MGNEPSNIHPLGTVPVTVRGDVTFAPVFGEVTSGSLLFSTTGVGVAFGIGLAVGATVGVIEGEAVGFCNPGQYILYTKNPTRPRTNTNRSINMGEKPFCFI